MFRIRFTQEIFLEGINYSEDGEEMFKYTPNELKLIKSIEECNYEYLIAKEKEKHITIKERIKYQRIKKSIEIKKIIHKYCKMYGVSRMPVAFNELKWSPQKHMEVLCLNSNIDKKIAVYTCISGKYDSIKEPKFNINPNINYIMFTDQDMKSEFWTIKKIPEKLNNLDSIQKNRYLKMHPHEVLEGFDYAIYVDGNVQIISDLAGLVNMIDKEIGFAMHFHCIRNCIYQEAVMCQRNKKGNPLGITSDVNRYLQEGYPRENGLLECTMFVTDLHSENSRYIYQAWWEEFQQSLSQRDQLSLPVVLWRNNIPISRVGTLGSNLYRNPKFRVLSHVK